MAEIELPEVEELEEKKHDSFTRRVALTTAVYAVFLAITALGGNNAMKEMLLAQQEATNKWAHYQAKVQRENLYRSQQMLGKLQLLSLGKDVSPQARGEIEKALADMAAQEERYKKEKEEIAREAREFEKERDLNRDKDPYFDYAEVLLQIAIVMSSVAILSSSRPIYGASLGFALLGILLSLNGFTLWVKVPFLHH
jgi:hypothetical protein